MEEDILEMIEPTPTPQTLQCKLLIKSIELFLRFGMFIIAGLFFYMYDLSIACVALLVSYLVIGIVRSKMRIASIPFFQLELNYTDKAIAHWYGMKHLCYEKGKKEKNSLV